MNARVLLTTTSAIVALTSAACGGGSIYELPIETPIRPKLDISAFQRVLVAGFLSGGSDEVDGNVETVRLLRSQLRSKSQLRVIDADALPLLQLAATPGASVGGTNGAGGAAEPDPADLEDAVINDDEDLEAHAHIFGDVAYWKRIGEEFQNPLIVTGSVMFTAHQRQGFVQREEEVYDTFGRRSVVPIRTFQERKGFILKPKFIFIDGRTGTTLYSESFREEVLYPANQETPALSSYFELMERLIPSFLGALSSQSVRGTRVLLK
jgi:hypothetical protein